MEALWWAGFKTLWITVAPFVIFLALLGIAFGLFQSATGVQEPVASQAVKLLGMSFLIYLLAPWVFSLWSLLATVLWSNPGRFLN